MRIAVTLAGLVLMVCAAAQAETVAVPVKQAVVEHDDMLAQERVNVALTPEGQRRLAEFTRDRVGRTIHLRVDGVLLTSPTLRSPIEGDALQLSPGLTGFGKLSAQEIARRLNVGGVIDISDDK